MADHDLDLDELADIVDLIERLIFDGHCHAAQWRPVLRKMKAQQATLSQRRTDATTRGDDQ